MSCQPCMCGSGLDCSACCYPCLMGDESAGTAEALMRSRYSAYVTANERYLLDTWHPATRPVSLNLDTDVQWVRLKILNSSEHYVEFVATYKINGKAHKLHENSRFVFENGRWYYVEGESAEQA